MQVRRRAFGATVALSAAALVAALLLRVPVTSAPPDSEPVPIQRIQLPPARLAAEMERVGRHTLVQVEQREFEELVRQARMATQAAAQPPRLLAAHYHARWSAGGLVGSAELKIAHSGTSPGRINLQLLQLALRTARWSDNEDALIGFLDEKPNPALELLVDKPGVRTLALTWSARTRPGPDGEYVDLQLPAHPIATLQLELPGDMTPQANREGVLLTGPDTSGPKGWSRWQLSFGSRAASGQSVPIELVLRRPDTPGRPGPLLRPLYTTEQRIRPGFIDCEFNVDLQVQRGAVRDLVFHGDANLRILDVALPNIENWESKSIGAATELRVRLREPMNGGQISIKALTPLPGAELTWTSPALRLVGAISRGEKLQLHVHPDLALEDWQPGSFRLLEQHTAAEQFQVLVLNESIVPAAQRPQARVRSVGAVFDVLQNTDWHLNPAQMTLTSTLVVTVQRGVLIQVPLTVPVGWEVESVEAVPTDPGLRFETKLQADGASVLMIEPTRPPSKSEPTRQWTIRCRTAAGPALAANAQGTNVPVPDLFPHGQRRRTGSVTIHPGATFTAVSATATATNELTFPLTTSVHKGTVQVRPRLSRLQARCDGDFVLAAGRLRVKQQLQVTPLSGSPQELLAYCGARGVIWSAQTLQGSSAVQRIEPWFEREVPATLAVLAVNSPWGLLTRHAFEQVNRGHWMRIVLDRPVTEPLVLELTTELAVVGKAFLLPLLAIPDAERFEGQASFAPGLAGAWRSEATGIREVRPRDANNGRQDFTYSSPPYVVEIKPVTQTRTVVPTSEAQLLLRLNDDGAILGRFLFALAGWHERSLAVTLPSGATFVRASIAGKLVTAQAGASDGAGVRSVILPWLPADRYQQAEIVYRLEAPRRPWPYELTAPAPELPVAVEVRRTWRLPEHIVPLGTTHWRPLSGGQFETPPVGWSWPGATATAEQRQRLDEAAKAVLNVETVGQALLLLATTLARDGGTLVLDATALRAAGITPQTEFTLEPPRPCWEAAGLAHVATKHASLLTSQRQAQTWTAHPPADIQSAVDEAVQFGRDRSGRFCTVADWLGDDPALVAVADDDGLRFWQDWQALPGQEGVRLLVVPVLFARCLGLMIAAIFGCAAGWQLATTRSSRWLLLVLLGSVSILAWVWLPSSLSELGMWPCAALGVVAFVTGRRRTSAISHGSAPTAPVHQRADSSQRARSVLLVLGLFVATPGTAAGPGPTPVYLIGGEPAQVLAPPELLERLGNIRRQGQPTAHAVLVQSQYLGRTDGDTARFEGHFVIQCFGGSPAAFILPLGGVQLREALLNGVPALPKAAGERYVFELPGSGRHSLAVRFDVPISGGMEKELRFSVPEAALNTMRLAAPADAVDLQGLTFRGASQTRHEEGRPVLAADLGRAGAVLVRWRQAGTVPPAGRWPVQENCLWEVRESTARLLAVFRYRLGTSVQRSLDFFIPAELTVAQIDVRALDEHGAAAGLANVRSWRQHDVAGQQRITVELAVPGSGDIQATLELLPREKLSLSPALPTPAALGDFEHESFLAVRVLGWAASLLEVRGCVRTAPDVFFREQWQPLRVDTEATAPQFVLQRLRPDAFVRIGLKPVRGQGAAAQFLDWQLDPDTATLQAELRCSQSPTPGLVEWDVPAEITISEVRGTGLRQWSRHGQRVQAWLDRSGQDTDAAVTLHLTGVLARKPAMGKTDNVPFTIPTLALPQANVQATTIRIRPRNSWRLEVVDPGTFQSLPDSDLPGFGWSGFAEAPSAIAVRLQPARGSVATATILQQVELAGRTLGISSYVMLVPPPDQPLDRPNTLWFDVAHNDAARLTLDLPPGARVRETRVAPGSTSWAIDFAPGKTALTISSRRALAGAQEFGIPLVTVRSAAQQTRQLVLHSPDLQPLASAGIVRGESRGSASSSWRIGPDVTRLRLRYAPGSGSRTTSASIVTAQAVAAVDSLGHWLVEAKYNVLVLAEADWNVAWLPGTAALAFALDGRPAPFTDTGIHIALSPGIHEMRMVWRTAHSLRDPSPQFRLPELPADLDATVHWGIIVPPGYHPNLGALQPLSLVQRSLRSAADWDRIRQVYGAQMPAATLQALDSRRERALRLAELRLLTRRDAAGELGSNDLEPAEWLRQAQERNAPAAALPDWNEAAPFADLFQGAATWFTGADGNPPMIVIAAISAATPERLAITGFVAILCVIVGGGLVRFGKLAKAA